MLEYEAKENTIRALTPLLTESKILSAARSNVLSNRKVVPRTATMNVDVRLRMRLYNVPPNPAISDFPSFDFHCVSANVR